MLITWNFTPIDTLLIFLTETITSTKKFRIITKFSLREKRPWHRNEERFPRRSRCFRRTIRFLPHCHSRRRWAQGAPGPPSSRCWWGTAVENLGARRSWSGRVVAKSTWFRIGTVVVDSVVVRICRGSVGPIWRRDGWIWKAVMRGTAEMIR